MPAKESARRVYVRDRSLPPAVLRRWLNNPKSTTRYKTTFAVSTAALAIAQAFPAHAQQAETAMTEVVVTAARGTADRSSVAGLGDAPLLLTPASVSVITRDQMLDLNIRSTTDAARFDASISDAY